MLRGAFSQTSFGSRSSISVSFLLVDSVSNFQEFVQTYTGIFSSFAASNRASVPILFITLPERVIESHPIKKRSQPRIIERPAESTI